MSTTTDPDDDGDPLDGVTIREHPEYCPAEKETTLSLPGPADRFTITSFRGSLVRRLLAHHAFRVKWVNVLDGDREVTREGLHEVDGEQVFGVTGTLPVGALSIKSKPREATHHAAIVSERVLD